LDPNSTSKPEDKKTGKTVVEKLNNGIHFFFISSKKYRSIAMASSNHSKSEPSSRISVRQMDP
jgi:hypothetical protein